MHKNLLKKNGRSGGCVGGFFQRYSLLGNIWSVMFDWHQPWKLFLRLFCCAAKKFWQLRNIVVQRKSFANYCILY